VGSLPLHALAKRKPFSPLLI